VIVGAGFGGLTAARRLKAAPVEVILIDRNNYHLFQPLLYQVATAGLEPEQIAKPVRSILRRQENLEFQMGEAVEVDLEARLLRTLQSEIAYDYLILAVGTESHFFGKTDLERYSLPLKTLGDSIGLRNHILRCFERAAIETDRERKQALLTFVIIGAGPTGVEMAGALSELIHLVLAKDYPRMELEDVRILLVEAEEEALPGFPAPLGQAARKELERKGVEVVVGRRLLGYDGRQVRLAGKPTIPSKTLIWAAGVKAAALAGQLPAERGKAGRVVVEPSLQLPGAPHVYVIGDAAYMEEGGEPLPMMAPVAVQMAERAVENIRRDLAGEEVLPFVYKDPGSLATIGRNAAVANIGGVQFRGFLAWIVWLVLHLVQLIGFRNRLLVFINWAWDYLFYDRAVRLIAEASTRGEPS
jgi:NADH dehydrogenase